ncbi:MAG: four helix bundle protein [Patescibacteria group bacterium]|nr:four helix bundle protein [Patescibacteria group bacterium]
MKISRFEDVIAWQIGRELISRLYSVLGKCKDYSFRDQLQRAAVSINNNIAEGFGRIGNKEFIRYLKISKGSCLEVRSMLYTAKDIKLIEEVEFKELFTLTVRIEQILVNLIKSIELK